ncbi:MAG: ATPase [Candidatus Melainabacteria bacterium HGW-Melainabacteria-1]|nr:MAG: ATPase [Candidatus Melainabacteria bacterium HGW-Melainabacteria-1]
MESMNIQGVELILSQPTRMDQVWVGNLEVKRQLEAAWLILSNQDLPMNPRIIGKPGIGKTTLAYAVACEYAEDVYIFQCTVDTRPEDLLVTPVIGAGQQIRYHASPLVTAMLRGGICILDEGNRMGEKSWASLAPLLDTRRYVESIIAGIKIPAHPNFRLAVTMNEDASTFDVPDYIQSRLQPQIEVGFPTQEEELEILRVNLPDAPEDVLRLVSEFLQRGHEENKAYTTRDGVNISRYAVKLIHLNQIGIADAVEQSLLQVLDPAAHVFFVENCLGPPESVLRPLEVLLLGASGPFSGGYNPFSEVLKHDDSLAAEIPDGDLEITDLDAEGLVDANPEQVQADAKPDLKSDLKPPPKPEPKRAKPKKPKPDTEPADEDAGP